MKILNWLSAIAICLIFSASIVAASIAEKGGDDLLGVWLTESKKAHVEIYKTGDKYFGKIIYLKDPRNEQGKPKVDKNNPDKGKKNTPLMGLNLLRSFEYDEDWEWEDGQIYDPENGKDYSCIIYMKTIDQIEVRGYVGFSMIGRSQIWTRVK